MDQRDINRVADRLNRIANQLRDGDLETALAIAHEWSGNVQAAGFDPSGRPGHRHEVYEENGEEVVAAIPQDPTGEAAFTDLDQLRHARLVAAFGVVDHGSANLTTLISNTVPEQRRRAGVPSRPFPDDEVAPTGACKSCWRDHRYYEPTAEGLYSDLCRWCGDFNNTHKRWPPVELMDLRHRKQRITSEQIKAALQPKGKAAKICGQITTDTPDGEPLACAHAKKHTSPHSWAAYTITSQAS